ncbi:LysR family transcriptional regulator, partial [Bacillus cereus]
AQPPLSKQIKDLDEEIGAKLFNRTKRHVELTNAGQVFLDKAYQILDQVEQACISTRLTSTGTEGELVIGFSGSVQDLIQTIQRYRERYPKVGIVLQQLSTPIQVKNLIEKKIDIGILAAPISSSKIHVSESKRCALRLLFLKNILLRSNNQFIFMICKMNLLLWQLDQRRHFIMIRL